MGRKSARFGSNISQLQREGETESKSAPKREIADCSLHAQLQEEEKEREMRACS